MSRLHVWNRSEDLWCFVVLPTCTLSKTLVENKLDSGSGSCTSALRVLLSSIRARILERIDVCRMNVFKPRKTIARIEET